MSQSELLARAFKVLQRAEGFFAAAAFREITEPPFTRGRAAVELEEIRVLLGDFQAAERETKGDRA